MSTIELQRIEFHEGRAVFVFNLSELDGANNVKIETALSESLDTMRIEAINSLLKRLEQAAKFSQSNLCFFKRSDDKD